MPQPPAVHHRLEGAYVGVEAPVVEHAQYYARLLGRVDQSLPRRGRGRERLVGDHVHPCGQRLEHELLAGLRRRGDRHRIHPGRQHVRQGGVDIRARQVGTHRCSGPLRAHDDARQLHALGRLDERSVEEPPAVAVSHESESHCVLLRGCQCAAHRPGAAWLCRSGCVDPAGPSVSARSAPGLTVRSDPGRCRRRAAGGSAERSRLRTPRRAARAARGRGPWSASGL